MPLQGSGRTFGRYSENAQEVTIDRIVRDGIELAEYLKEHLGQRQIMVLGHSFGSIVAIEMIQRAPEHFSVYIGTGQFTSFQESVNAQFNYLLKIAETNDDINLSNQLEEIRLLGSANLAKFFQINQLLFGHLPVDDATWFQQLQSRMPEVMAPKELADWQAGQQASARQLMPEVAQVNLRTTASSLQIPFIIIQGGDDIYSPTNLVMEYFDEVESPQKELVIVEGAAHFAHLTHTEQFLDAMNRLVLP